MPLRARWLLLWIALAALLVGRAASRPAHRGVLNDHLEFGRRLLHGENVYADWKSDLDAPTKPLHAPYPPSFGLLTTPFHLVDAALGQRAARGVINIGAGGDCRRIRCRGPSSRQGGL